MADPNAKGSSAAAAQNEAYCPVNYRPEPDPEATCRWCTLAVYVGLVIFFGTGSFFIEPDSQLPEFRVDSFSVSNFKLTNDSLASFTSQIRLTARNLNKKTSLSYDGVLGFKAEVFYGSALLSETMIRPFHDQDPETEASLTANLTAAGSFLDKLVVDSINFEIGMNGNVGYDLIILSRIKFEEDVSRTTTSFMRVFCGNLRVSIPSNGSIGTLVGGPRMCGVDI